MDKQDKKSDYLKSLKALETENYLDRIFYRPIGYMLAKALKNTGITPNTITIISIVFGVFAGIFWWFHPYNFVLALLGVLALVTANILDCVDGQLARMTGIKSEIGRILDGFAGDLWFLSIYIAFIHRLNMQFDLPFGPWLFTIIAIISAIMHWNQASITDYYKTLHLLFISKEKGKEFENSTSIKDRYKSMKPGIKKLITWGYVQYTVNQERQTPELQKMMVRLKEKYGEYMPEDVREEFRQKSLKIMPRLNINTFNGRSILLFVSVLSGYIWLYFAWEIIVLSINRAILMKKHERICKETAVD